MAKVHKDAFPGAALGGERWRLSSGIVAALIHPDRALSFDTTAGTDRITTCTSPEARLRSRRSCSVVQAYFLAFFALAVFTVFLAAFAVFATLVVFVALATFVTLALRRR